jgi:glycosyltransferase involved in cell wall biosynthesis
MILTIFIAAIQIGLALQASKNLKRFRMLQVSERAEDYEKLSVCVPMRNEAKNADRILSELIREKELIHEIWILDDGSTDDTQQILLKYQKRYPELVHIMRGKEKPDDWKGKIWAMRQLAGSATAELILFLDADVHIHEGAIIALLTEQRVTNAAYLSIFPKQNTSSATDMLINHIYTSLLHLLPMQLIDDARYPGAVAGCGQVQLVYESFSEAWKGFRRNAFEATGGYLPLLATTSILVISFVLAPITIVAGKLPAYIIVASSVALYGNYLRISKRFDLSPFFIVRLPFSVILSTLLQWSSVVRHTLGMKETWRGRKV